MKGARRALLAARAGFLLSSALAILVPGDPASNGPPRAWGFCAPILKRHQQTQQTTQELANLLAGQTQTQPSDG